MIRRVFLLLVTAQLAGCASASRTRPEPEVRIVEVQAPTAIPCGVKVARPTFPDSDSALQATGEPASMLEILAAGRFVRQRYVAELEAAVTGCGGAINEPGTSVSR